MAAPTWGDGSYWGDGDKYYGRSNTIYRYRAIQEVLTYSLSVRVNYTVSLVPGATDSLKIYRISTRTNRDQQ